MARPRGKHLTGEERAALTAALAAGENPTHVARRFGMCPSTARKQAKRMIAAAAAPSVDSVEKRRLIDQIRDKDRVIRDLERRAARAEDWRAGVFGLTKPPLVPSSFPAPPAAPPQAETIVCFLSDLHWGETVDIAALDGLNSYSLAIARARLGRWVRAVIDLATRHWSGPRPARLMLVLGGDLISGEIHGELAKTNEAMALPAVRDVAEHLIGALRALRAALPGVPIDVIEVGGNHGRSTLKPESKGAAITSYDMLVGRFVELAVRDLEGVTFFAPPSPDALVSIYGWRVLLSHGDRIGSRGGQGFIGPAATAARGLKRIMMDYMARGVGLDLILIGHFHTPLLLEEGFVNGSLVGPSEYSRDGRFRPHPAKQLFLAIHPRRLVTQVRWIEVGHPAEGSLYEAPPEDRPLRPRYRIQAPGVKVQ